MTSLRNQAMLSANPAGCEGVESHFAVAIIAIAWRFIDIVVHNYDTRSPAGKALDIHRISKNQRTPGGTAPEGPIKEALSEADSFVETNLSAS